MPWRLSKEFTAWLWQDGHATAPRFSSTLFCSICHEGCFGYDIRLANFVLHALVQPSCANDYTRSTRIGIGDSITDNIDIGGEFVSDLVPNDDDTYDLGITTQRWRNGNFSGLVTTQNLYVSGTSTIDGGVDISGDLSVTGFVSVTEGLYYDLGDYNPPNGIGYFDNTGKLVSSASTTSAISTSYYILTTEEISGVPTWTSTIDGGIY